MNLFLLSMLTLITFHILLSHDLINRIVTSQITCWDSEGLLSPVEGEFLLIGDRPGHAAFIMIFFPILWAYFISEFRVQNSEFSCCYEISM